MVRCCHVLLLIDDDPVFLTEAEQALRPSCRKVLFALNAEHARTLMHSVGVAVTVVMVDLSLGSDNGFALVREFHQQYPSLPIIAISDVLPQDVLDSAKVFGAAETLMKPITPAWQATLARVRSRAAHP